MPAIPYASDRSAAEVHRALRSSLSALDEAHQCAVLWFGEVMRRRLYRDLGYSSINQYALTELGFSRSRTGDFICLARRLDDLPAVRKAVASGELGYTKAREIVAVATPATEKRWLAVAQGTRRELIREVKRVKRAAKSDPAQGELMPSAATVVAPRELPVRFQVELNPEQEARRAALVERLHKLGGVPADRAELLLEALAALVETKEDDIRGNMTPRGAHSVRPPVMIHVHEDTESGQMTVQTASGERGLSRAEAERLRCDATICQPGKRSTTTIPPRVRREVLARDHHRCQAPGCGRTQFLEVHHKVARSCGGDHQPEAQLRRRSSAGKSGDTLQRLSSLVA